MAPRKGRHPRQKGPGGPRRSSRIGGDVIPIGHAPSARHREGLLGPSIDNLVRSLLSALRTLAPADPASRPIGIEVWADRMAETVYGPKQMPEDFYSDLADGLLVSPDPDARPALAALAHVLDHRDAAPLRRAHDDHRARVGADDPTDLGIGRAVARAGFEIDHVQGDGVTLMVDVDQPGAPHCVGVYLDHNMGGLAKDLLVGPPWAELERDRLYRDAPGMRIREIPLAELRARYEEAVDLTDHTMDPPTAEDFADTRPLVERRIALLPEGGKAPEPTIPEAEEVEAIVAEFLRSPEAGVLSGAERDEAIWLIDLWITHATGYALGDPHRLSPTLVEMFCVDWYPRKVLGDPPTPETAARVLSAWARYAARLSDLDDQWLDEAVEAIERWTPAMSGGGPPRGGDALLRGLGGGAGPLDDLDPELRDVILRVRALEGITPEALDAELDSGSRLLALFDHPEGDARWTPLRPTPPGSRRVHWEADPSGIRPELVSKVKVICLQASFAAARLLGPEFVQPAVDLAVRIGTLDPSPLPHTQDAVWSSAVVWLLADDAGAFSREPGRTRDDLAADLPMARGTTTKRVTEIRERLGLAKGDLAIDW